MQCRVGSRFLSCIVLSCTFLKVHTFQWTSALFLFECVLTSWNADSKYVYVGFPGRLYSSHSHQTPMRISATLLWQHLAFFFLFSSASMPAYDILVSYFLCCSQPPCSLFHFPLRCSPILVPGWIISSSIRCCLSKTSVFFSKCTFSKAPFVYLLIDCWMIERFGFGWFCFWPSW